MKNYQRMMWRIVAGYSIGLLLALLVAFIVAETCNPCEKSRQNAGCIDNTPCATPGVPLYLIYCPSKADTSPYPTDPPSNTGLEPAEIYNTYVLDSAIIELNRKYGTLTSVAPDDIGR